MGGGPTFSGREPAPPWPPRYRRTAPHQSKPCREMSLPQEKRSDGRVEESLSFRYDFGFSKELRCPGPRVGRDYSFSTVKRTPVRARLKNSRSAYPLGSRRLRDPPWWKRTGFLRCRVISSGRDPGIGPSHRGSGLRRSHSDDAPSAGPQRCRGSANQAFPGTSPQEGTNHGPTGSGSVSPGSSAPGFRGGFPEGW